MECALSGLSNSQSLFIKSAITWVTGTSQSQPYSLGVLLLTNALTRHISAVSGMSEAWHKLSSALLTMSWTTGSSQQRQGLTDVLCCCREQLTRSMSSQRATIWSALPPAALMAPWRRLAMSLWLALSIRVRPPHPCSSALALHVIQLEPLKHQSLQQSQSFVVGERFICTA